MDWFSGKLAVVTGGGSGMGRELARQLAAGGCSVATCDWHPDAVERTGELARAGAAPGVRVTSHACDVSVETEVLRFRDEVLQQHSATRVDLVFSNAGIGGGASFVRDSRETWERTFAVDWWGVYYCARAFLPLLIASEDGVLVNTSSVDGFWATGGPQHRVCRGEVCRQGLHRGVDRGLAGQRAAGPGRPRNAGACGHRHHREQPPRSGPARARGNERRAA